MSWLDYFRANRKPEPPSADQAKERLQILLAHERIGRTREDFLPRLQQDLVAVVARYTRASMLEVTRKDYIRIAHSKGLKERSVVVIHMIRNALIPVVTILGPLLAALVTGSFIIEILFSIPGIGRFYVTAIAQRDYGLIMAMTMLYAAAVAIMNMVVDILYAYIDPRIRYS